MQGWDQKMGFKLVETLKIRGKIQVLSPIHFLGEDGSRLFLEPHRERKTPKNLECPYSFSFRSWKSPIALKTGQRKKKRVTPFFIEIKPPGGEIQILWKLWNSQRLIQEILGLFPKV